MPIVEVPNVGVVSFPDGMSDADISSAIQGHYQRTVNFAIGAPRAIESTLERQLTAAVPGTEQAKEDDARRFAAVIPPTDFEGIPLNPSEEELAGMKQGAKEAMAVPGRAIGAVAEPVLKAGGDIVRETLKEYGLPEDALTWPAHIPIPITEIPGTGVSPLKLIAPNIGEGVEERAGRLASQFTQPEQLATLPFTGLKAVQAFYGASAAANIPESVQELLQAKSMKEAGSAATGLVADVAMATSIGKHLLKGETADASKIQEAAEVHGDVRPQPESTEELPVEGGGEGVQPQAETVAQTPQVSLAERQAQRAVQEFRARNPVTYEDVERQAIDHGESQGVNVVIKDTLQDPNAPFGKGRQGVVAIWNPKTKSVEFDRGELNKELSALPPDQHQALVERRVGEEIIHSKITNEEAAEAWKNEPAIGKALVNRRYTGKWAGLAQFAESDMGHELLRGRIQMLQGLDPTEVLATAGREKWTTKTVYGLEKLLTNLRERLGTKASWAQREMMDNAMKNLGFVAARMGATPAGFRRPTDDELADSVKEFRDNIDKPGMGGGTNRAVKAGMGAKSLADLEALANLRRDIIEKSKTMGDMDSLERHTYATLAQYAREAIEVAANVGSNDRAGLQEIGRQIGNPKMDPGERPLDWKEHPEVAEWLKFHGPPLSIKLPEGLKLPDMGMMGERAEGPAGFRKPKPGEGKKGKPGTQPEFFPGMAGGGMPGEERNVPRGTAEELGALPKLKSSDLENRAAEIVVTGKDLGTAWKQFASYAEHETGAKPEQVRSMWMDQVWGNVLRLSGRRLMEMRRSLGLESKIGLSRGKVSVRAIPDAREELSKEEADRLAVEGTAVSREQNRQTIERANKYRMANIKAIGLKLIQQAMPRYENLHRTNFEVDDIDFGHDKTTVGAYYELTDNDLESKDRLETIFSDSARPEHSSKISMTKRLMALVNKRTGAVELVSVYLDGRRGLKVTEPTGATGVRNRPHSPISSVMAYYRPFASVLIGDPVQVFRKHYDSLRQFSQQVGKEAARRERVVEWAWAGEPATDEFQDPSAAPEGLRPEEFHPEEREPETGVRRETAGTFAGGPGAAEMAAMTGSARGVLEKSKNYPITANEVNAVRDFVKYRIGGEEGELTSPEQMRSVIDNLLTSAETMPAKAGHLATWWKGATPNLRGQDFMVISALSKVADHLQRKFDLTPDQAYERALGDFYEAITKAKTPEDYTIETMGRFTEPPQQVRGQPTPAIPGAPARAAGVARELTMRQRLPPTVVRPQPGIPAVPRQPAPAMPEGTPGAVRAPQMLPEAAQAQVEAQAGPAPPTGQPAWRDIAEMGKPTGKWPRFYPSQKNPIAFQTASGLLGPRTKGPAGFRRGALDEQFSGIMATIRGEFARATSKVDLSRLKQAANTLANNMGNMARVSVQLPSVTKWKKGGDQMTLEAAKAINSIYSKFAPANDWPSPGIDTVSHPDYGLLDAKLKDTQEGQRRAQSLIDNPTQDQLNELGLQDITGLSRGQMVTMGRKWLKSAQRLEKEVQYAKDNFGDPVLMETAQRMRSELQEQLKKERDAASSSDGLEDYVSQLHEEMTKLAVSGKPVAAVEQALNELREMVIRKRREGKVPAEVENYLQGLYEGDLWGDSGVHFGGAEVLGRIFGQKKTFSDYYDAIKAGPYIPKAYSAADIVAHRVRSGMSRIEGRQAFDSALTLTDPVSKGPIAVPMQLDPAGGYRVPEGKGQFKAVYPWNGGKPLAVRKGYVRLMNNLFSESVMPDTLPGKAALYLNSALKHGFLLVADSYHLGKLGAFSASISGREMGWKGGWTALNLRPEDMDRAAEQGLIPPGAAEWAKGTENIWMDGKKVEMPRYEIARMFQKRGLNVGANSDALYKHFVDNWDVNVGGRRFGAGAFNRYLFDKLTRGFMLEGAVNEFVRLNRSAPNIEATKLMDRISSDMNDIYGSRGVMGLIKNPTLRDYSQFVFLAPSWVGGLLAKEAKFAYRAAYSGPKALFTEGRAAADVELGTIGRSMARGLLFSFMVGQIINLATRRKLTFQNEEENHKWDAWVPDFNGGPGHWISPLSVFAEISHDIVRLAYTKPKFVDAIRQIGQNKLSPWGRAALVAAISESPTGEKLTTTPSYLKSVAAQLAPIPISLGRYAQSGLHQLLPGMVSPPTPGSIQRQTMASMGIKTEIAKSAAQQTFNYATDFMKEHNLSKETGWVQSPTDEASYSKLRTAVRTGDNREIKRNWDELKKTHDEGQMIESLAKWTTRPFTRSAQAEPYFQKWMDENHKGSYERAMNEKVDVLLKFMQWYNATHPESQAQ